MNENESKYLSLKTAAGLYGYTRDHLGLMIRQGKLRGIKLGSYYVTTSDWVTDYLKNYADPGHPAAAGKFSNKFLAQAFAVKENKKNVFPSAKTKKVKDKILKLDVPNKLENNFFSKIQKELLPSIEELSAARDKPEVLLPTPNERHADIGNSYIILPIRIMEESERNSIIRKISGRHMSEDEFEAI